MAAYYRRSWALVIGINDYGNRHTPLVNAVRDAQGVATVLRETYRFDSVTTLVDHEATLQTMRERKMLERWSATQRAVWAVAGRG